MPHDRRLGAHLIIMDQHACTPEDIEKLEAAGALVIQKRAGCEVSVIDLGEVLDDDWTEENPS